jgi:hypothetical protein
MLLGHGELLDCRWSDHPQVPFTTANSSRRAGVLHCHWALAMNGGVFNTGVHRGLLVGISRSVFFLPELLSSILYASHFPVSRSV